MDRDEIKFIPVGDGSGSNVGELEDEEALLMSNNMTMMTEPCGNPCHRDMDSSSWDSAADGFRRLANIVRNGVHMNRRTIARALGPYKKNTDSRLTKVEAGMKKLAGDMGNLRGGMGKLEATVEKHEGDMRKLKGGMGYLEGEMAELKGNFQMEFENLKNYVFGLNNQFVPRTNDLAPKKNAADAPVSSRIDAGVEGTLKTPKPPVLQFFWADDPANSNDVEPAPDAGQVDQAEGHVNLGLADQEEVMRLDEHGPGIPQVVYVQGNNNGRVEKPRILCKYCGQSYSCTYVKRHERKKCPKRPKVAV